MDWKRNRVISYSTSRPLISRLGRLRTPSCVHYRPCSVKSSIEVYIQCRNSIFRPKIRVLIREKKKPMNYLGQSADLRHISLHGLLPETEHYMTYEGSTTHPGCWETTSWIIFNKPIYITRQEVYSIEYFFPLPPPSLCFVLFLKNAR